MNITKQMSAAKLLLEDTLLSAANSSRIICDVSSSFKLIKKPEVVTEAKTGRRFTRLTSLIQKADAPNENGRVYPLDVMKEAIEDIQPSVASRMVLGELDHPDDAKIHTENACLLLTRVWMEGLDVYGEFEILEGMPKGQMLKALIDQGVSVSISSRGVGDMEVELMEDGSEVNKVLPGFRFVCFDAVNEPSVRGTQLNMMESKQRVRNQARHANEMKLAKAMKSFLN